MLVQAPQPGAASENDGRQARPPAGSPERGPQFSPRFEHVTSLAITFARPEMIGEAPDGIRCNFFVERGVLRGPRLTGEVLPHGADHMIVRRDGVGEVRVRAVIRSSDGAMISAEYQGICDWGSDGYRKLLAGELPEVVEVHTTPRFYTPHPRYQWLNRAQFVGLGKVDVPALSFEYDMYELHLQHAER